tara:strand:- start:32356 stop:33030 length:675 start_codon:yes stop_codon:yes gene_type:complete
MTSLGILQLTSPALPVGAFSYSEGLEWLVQNKIILNKSTLYDWLISELLRGQIRLESASQSYIRTAFENCQKYKDQKSLLIIKEWDSWILALRDSAQVRKQHKQMGKSLIDLLVNMGHALPCDINDLSWPLAWGWAGLAWNISEIEVTQGYLYSWVANQLSAAVRLIPIGPTEAQQLQFSLLPLIELQAKELLTKDPHELWTGDLGATMAQGSHSELYSKLFRS